MNNHHDAEDVAQESFVIAWQQLPRYRHEASFTTWLYRIATNRALNHARRAQREGLPLEQLEQSAVDPHPGPADQTLTAAATTAVRKAIAELPLEQRVTLVLRQFEQLSYAEIADIRGSSVPAVRSHLLRARRAVALQLKDWR